MEKILDHEARALATLPEASSQFERALVAAWARQMQRLEDALFVLVSQGMLDTATGVWLDDLGAIVGEPRERAEDEDYRLRVRARVLVNRSRGRGGDVLGIFALLTTQRLVLVEEPPCGFTLRLASGPVAYAGTLARILQLAKGAGIYAALYTLNASPENTFTFTGGGGKGFPTPGVPGSGGTFASLTSRAP